VKYIMFWEYSFENHEKVMEKLKKFREAREKNPENFPKFISKNYAMLEGPRGFQLIETENEEHLVNIVFHYQPEVWFNFEPIIEVKKSIELYQKLNK
jgi:hypothetical protein